MDVFHHMFHRTRLVFNEAVKADQYGRQTHEAVQYGNQLWHFGHFDFLRQIDTNGTTDHHGNDDPANVAGIWAKDGSDQRNGHPDYAKNVTLLGRFVFRQTRQTKNKQDCGNNVCCSN